MSRIVSEIHSQAEWLNSGPRTRAQRFIRDYSMRVDRKDFDTCGGLRYYSTNVTFHNQNNAEYHGGEQAWTWMKELFAPFEKMRHDVHQLYEIDPGDGSGNVIVEVRVTRNIWMKGNTGEKPDVSVPVHLTWIIGEAETEGACEGLQFKEVWIFWDTALLMPFLEKNAVTFRKKNPYEE
jgi:hypothetical protein